MDELTVGQSAEREFPIDDARVRAFAEVSGDRNPVHLDEACARGTMFRGRVAHGMLLGGFISAVLGEALPGPGSIYLGQSLEFLHPVRLGETVRIKVTVESLEGPRAILRTEGFVGDKRVADGRATVVPPRRRKVRAG